MTKADQSQDWRDAKVSILNALDISAEFEALGVQFTKSKPSAKGWRECTATFRDEKHPSAAVNVGDGPARGRYKDLGGDGRTISLFDFAVRAGRQPNYKAALQFYAQRAGVTLPNGDEPLVTDLLDMSKPTPGMLLLYAGGKPGVTPQAMLATGAMYVRYPKNAQVERSQFLFMVPMYGPSLLDLDPVGWHGCPIDPNRKFRLWKGPESEPELKKVWNATGSNTGIMGLDTLRRLAEIKVIIWCEGLSDLWACQEAIIADGTREVGCLGLPGANCHLDAATVHHFAGKKHLVVYDVGDADNAGQNGAAILATTLLPGAASVRNVQLPLGADGKKRDLRDWFCESHTLEDLVALAKTHAPIDPAKPPTVLPGEPIIVRLSDVQPEDVRWLWPGRIALGKLTMFAGDPGLGKSFATIDLAARVSRGQSWPDDNSTAAPLGGVVILNAEDDLADTIRPRLDAAGADSTRIIALTAVRKTGESGALLDSPFVLSQDLAALESAIRKDGDCRLVIVDPISAYLGGIDTHNNADVRGVLAPLSALAARYKVAIVAVSHLNKSGGPAIYRTTGSLAFVAASRAAWLFAKDVSDQERRLLLPAKNNLAKDTQGMAFRIVDGVVQWETEPVSIDADEALQASRDDDSADVDDWLRTALADGPVESKKLMAEAESNGISPKRIWSAKKRVGAQSRKLGFKGGWEWWLPNEDSQDSQDSLSQTEGTLEFFEKPSVDAPEVGDNLEEGEL